MSKKKFIRIGFDLDGVIIDKPPFIPRSIIGLLVHAKNHRYPKFRFPKTYFERFVRWLSHNHNLRPPINNNLKFVKKLSKNKNYELYVISGRYDFLEGRTKEWFNANGLNGIFKKVYINLKNEQPHIFKEKVLKKLKCVIYFEDDELIVSYLTKKLGERMKVYLISKNTNISEFL